MKKVQFQLLIASSWNPCLDKYMDNRLMHSDEESSISVADGFFMESPFGQVYGQSRYGSHFASFEELTASKGVLCGS